MLLLSILLCVAGLYTAAADDSAAVAFPTRRIIETLPERNPEGKLLTMREATITRSVYPHPSSEALSALPRPVARPESRFGVREGVGVYMLGSSCDTLWIARDSATVHYGVSVSRNEFGIDGGLFPSPDGTRLAFYRKDESAVGTFPLLDIRKGNGTLREIPYPMNGTPSEIVDLLVYDCGSGKTVRMEVGDFTPERYITQVSWQTGNLLTAQILDRSQHDMHLNLYDSSTGKCLKTILAEHNDAWVEPYESQVSVSDGLFFYSTDNRDSFKNIYLIDLDGGVKRVTRVDADCEFIAWKSPYLYYYSAEVSPAQRHAYRVRVTAGKTASRSRIGRPEALTSERGVHSVRLLEDCLIDTYSSFSNPGVCLRKRLDGKTLDTLYTLSDPLEDYVFPSMEFGCVPSADGRFENHYRLLKPCGFDPSKKYPLLVYVYGGPHSQMVTDSWLGNIRMWEMLMAQRGYIVYVQDNRGTQNHGAAYEKAINRACGRAEMQDQMVGIRSLLSEPWVDRDKVAVHGWSYGGFMTISLALTYPEVFTAAVAGGPVIDWKWYEVMYGERYMDTEADNPEGFAQTRLCGKASRLSCPLLICQGAVDNTVVWENSLSFLQDCIDEGKQVDYFPFPIAEHNMRGSERVYLYQKITDWLDARLCP